MCWLTCFLAAGPQQAAKGLTPSLSSQGFCCGEKSRPSPNPTAAWSVFLRHPC